MRIALSCLAATLAASMAQADTSDEAIAEIHFEPASLQTEAGVAAVYELIRAEAKDACSDLMPGSRVYIHTDRRCADDIIERAITQINAPNLTLAIKKRPANALNWKQIKRRQFA